MRSVVVRDILRSGRDNISRQGCRFLRSGNMVALTAGPKTNLMTAREMARLATRVVDLGATAVLVNCTPAAETRRFLEAIVKTGIRVPVGAYANAGSPDDNIGWRADCEPGCQAYANFAKSWVHTGATIIGGCCGTGPGHMAAIREQLET